MTIEHSSVLDVMSLMILACYIDVYSLIKWVLSCIRKMILELTAGFVAC